MCGRYTLNVEAQELVEAFDVRETDLDFSFQPRFNIAPSQSAPIVARDRRGRRVGLMQWGLRPNWQDDPGAGFHNARSESAQEKASFREAFERRRCLVPADGFYEWRRDGEGKTPFWVHPPDERLLTFAGVWERWQRGDETHFGFAILTTDASPDLQGIHHRMPVVVPTPRWTEWLALDTPSSVVRSVLAPAPAGTFSLRRVSTRVNRVAEDDSDLVQAV